MKIGKKFVAGVLVMLVALLAFVIVKTGSPIRAEEGTGLQETITATVESTAESITDDNATEQSTVATTESEEPETEVSTEAEETELASIMPQSLIQPLAIGVEPDWGDATTVSNEAQLETALTSNASHIVLDATFAITKDYTINGSLKIDGNGNGITASGNNAYGFILGDPGTSGFLKVENMQGFGNPQNSTNNRQNAFFRTTDPAVGQKWSIYLLDSSTMTDNFKPLIALPSGSVLVESTTDAGNNLISSSYQLPVFNVADGEITFRGKNHIESPNNYSVYTHIQIGSGTAIFEGGTTIIAKTLGGSGSIVSTNDQGTSGSDGTVIIKGENSFSGTSASGKALFHVKNISVEGKNTFAATTHVFRSEAADANVVIDGENTISSGTGQQVILTPNGSFSLGGNNKISGATTITVMFIAKDIHITGTQSINKPGAGNIFVSSNKAEMNNATVTLTQTGNNNSVLLQSTSPTEPVQINNSKVIQSNSSATNRTLGSLVNATSDVMIDGLEMYDQTYDGSNADTARFYLDLDFIVTTKNVSINNAILSLYVEADDFIEANQKVKIDNSYINSYVRGFFFRSSYTNPTNQTEDYVGSSLELSNTEMYGQYAQNQYFTQDLKEFLITNGSKIDISHQRNIIINDISAMTFAHVQIDKRSNVKFTGTETGYQTMKFGGAFAKVDVLGDPTLEDRNGNTTLNMVSRSTQGAENGGVISFDTGIRGPAVYLNFKDYATVNIHANQGTGATPAVMIQAADSEFNVSNNSYVDFTSDGQSSSIGATLRFRYSGNSKFNLSENSVMRITKKSGDVAAVRMNGGGNSISVSSGSKFYVTNEGDGTPRDGGTTGGTDTPPARNQAIQFVNGQSLKAVDKFELTGEGSLVKLVAKNGAAIDGGNDLDVTAGEGTFFEAIGKTAGGPIFRTGTGQLEFNMTNPLYYDFRNNTTNTNANQKHLLGSADPFIEGRSAIFNSEHSDVSFWAKGTNLDGTPTYDRTLVSYALTGKDMVLESANAPDDDFREKFGVGNSVNQYSRMSANNATPNITGIRQATDADKSVYVFARVQEGYDDEGNRLDRPAWDDEAQIVVEIKEPGKEAYRKQATTVGGPTTIYNDTDQSGFAKIDFDDYLPAGTTIKVVDAWRGDEDSDPSLRHTTPQEELDAVPTMTVLDVTPPTPTTVTGDQVTNASKTIKGTGEAGATVLVKVNGEFLPETATVDAEGNWEYTFANAPQPGNTVQVYLRDSAAAVDLADRPATNTDDGNINPENDLPYHDAIFPGVTTYTVIDSVIDEATVTKAVESSSVTATGVGDTLTYTIDVSNDEADDGTSRPWNSVVLTDVLHEDFVEDGILASVMINDQAAGDKATIETSENGERILTVQLGDLNNGESVKVTFAAVVGPGAVGKIINNKAVATGDTSLEGHQLVRESEVVPNPGGEVFGTLALKEAPTVIDFGTGYIDGKDTRIDNPTYTGDLIVTDNRGDFRNPWKITAQLTTPLTTIDGSGEVLVDAIRYKNGDTEIPLNSEAQEIITGKNTTDEENISEGWSPEGDGFKLFVSKNNRTALGEYHAEILFTLSDVPGE